VSVKKFQGFVLLGIGQKKKQKNTILMQQHIVVTFLFLKGCFSFFSFVVVGFLTG